MKELDCLGLRCPQPIIAVARAMRDLEPGESLRLLSDDPATENDLRAWARMTGNLSETLGGNIYRVTKSSSLNPS